MAARTSCLVVCRREEESRTGGCVEAVCGLAAEHDVEVAEGGAEGREGEDDADPLEVIARDARSAEGATNVPMEGVDGLLMNFEHGVLVSSERGRH